MADNLYTADAINGLTGLLAGSIEAQATRPQKTSVITNATTSPYALQNMIANRDRIGQATSELNDALKAREGLGYTLASALAGIPQQQGAGSWLSDFARAFGGGMAAPTNAMVDRAQKKYEAEMKDLAEILAYDKAMGDNQYQEQRTKYEPMEYGTASKQAKGVGADSVGGIQQTNFGRSIGYDPVENIPDFGSITRAALSEEQVNPLLKYIGGSTFAKGLAENEAAKLQPTWTDISDNILSGKVLDFVGKAGSVRVADTPAEQEFIFGPIRNYQSMTPKQLKTGLKQARNNFVANGLYKASQQGVDVTEEELKNWWNSAFSVPEGMESNKMYNVQNAEKYAPKPQETDWTKYKSNTEQSPAIEEDPWAKYRTK